MDTTETYTKQCERSAEIQGLRPSRVDDHNYFYCQVHKWGCDLDGATWCPTQDQLQAMVKGQIEKEEEINLLDFELLELFYDYCYSDGSSPNTVNSGCDTFEKMWLAFCMSEKYNKRWDGEEWVDYAGI